MRRLASLSRVRRSRRVRVSSPGVLGCCTCELLSDLGMGADRGGSTATGAAGEIGPGIHPPAPGHTEGPVYTGLSPQIEGSIQPRRGDPGAPPRGCRPSWPFYLFCGTPAHRSSACRGGELRRGAPAGPFLGPNAGGADHGNLAAELARGCEPRTRHGLGLRPGGGRDRVNRNGLRVPAQNYTVIPQKRGGHT